MSSIIRENCVFDTSEAVQAALGESGAVFRWCDFRSGELNGGSFDGTFLSCAFADIDCYWGIFNVARFSECVFERCVFRGTAFAGCVLVECEFKNCRFIRDNLNAACSADETRLYACEFRDCEGWEPVFHQGVQEKKKRKPRRT
jgi:uncharacterized protein YjbI with pentapeptide repeats